MKRIRTLACALLASGCSFITKLDVNFFDDAGSRDAGARDARIIDTGIADGGLFDAGTDACAPTTWYADVDMDGHGDPNAMQSACIAPAGFIAVAGDCNDGAMEIHPGVAEVCDNADQDCDGAVDEGLMQPVGDPVPFATATPTQLTAAAYPDGAMVAWVAGGLNVAWVGWDGAVLSGPVEVAPSTDMPRSPQTLFFESAGVQRLLLAWSEPDGVQLKIYSLGTFQSSFTQELVTEAQERIALLQHGSRVMLAWNTDTDLALTTFAPTTVVLAPTLRIPGELPIGASYLNAPLAVASVGAAGDRAIGVVFRLDGAGEPAPHLVPIEGTSDLVWAGESSFLLVQPPITTGSSVWGWLLQRPRSSSNTIAAVVYAVFGGGAYVGCRTLLRVEDGPLRVGPDPNCTDLLLAPKELSSRGGVTAGIATGATLAYFELPGNPMATMSDAIELPGLSWGILSSAPGVATWENRGAVIARVSSSLAFQRIGCVP